MKTLDKVLIIVGSFVGAFIIATVVIYTVNGWQYDTLIPCVVGSGILETINTMIITVSKIRREKDADIDDPGNSGSGGFDNNDDFDLQFDDGAEMG